MLRQLGRRAVIGLAVVAGVVALTFVLLHVAPGDPIARLVGPAATAEQIAAQRHALALDQPLPLQLARWTVRAVRGDWGRSIATGQPVAELLGHAWPATVRLVALSLLASYLIGIVVGIVQASRTATRTDTALSVVTVTLFALPGYWLGLMLMMAGTYWLHVFPAFGAAGLDAEYLSPGARIVDALRHLALPLLTLTLIGVGGVARYTRGAMLEVRGEPFMVTARAKGVSPTRVLTRHALRNALLPIVTLLGLSLPALFSGAIFVEAVFAWPGVGRVLVEAVRARDYPVVMAATTISALLVVAGNLLADLVGALLDPRLRQSRDA